MGTDDVINSVGFNLFLSFIWLFPRVSLYM